MDFSIETACEELKIKKEIYVRIAARALEQTPADVAELQRAHDAQDIDTVQTISHRLKGDFANLRMKALSAAAGELNAMAKAEYDTVRALELIQGFHGLIDEVKIAVEAAL